MNSEFEQADSALTQRLIKISKFNGVVAIVIGVLAICGWAFNIRLLRSPASHLPEMVPNAAMCFVLAGAALLFLHKRTLGASTAGQSLSAAVTMIGFLTLIEYTFAWDIGIDRLFWSIGLAAAAGSGRIPLPGAINFFLFGTALFLSHRRSLRDQLPAQILAVLVISIALVILLGFAYEVASLYQSSTGTSVAVQGMILFVLLGTGLLFARPNSGLMMRITAADESGLLIRRLLPAAILVPAIVAWLRLQGEQSGLYGADFAVALHATANIVILSAMVWYTAADLRRANVHRLAAESKVHTQLARLDLLNHITRAIGERQDLHSIFQVVVRSLEDHLRVDFSCIGLKDPAEDTLVIVSVGARSETLAKELAIPEHTRIKVENNGLARSLQGILVYEPDVRELPFPFPRRLAQVGLAALVIVPLVVESEVLGVLIAARRDENSFSSADCEFLRQLGGHVALAAHHAQLYSALQRAYDDLRQSQQAILQQERLRVLGQMSSGIAHDINNAMTPASIYIDLLLENERHLSPEGQKYLKTVRRAVDDVTHTISRMREFYAQRDPKHQLGPVDLNRCARQVAELTRVRWRDMAQERGVAIDVRLDLSESLPRIMGVENEIRDALTNLLLNGIDAMPDGGVLKVRTSVVVDKGDGTINAATAAAIEVSDTGTGMDEETKRRCMEPFFTTKGERGTGLGLAMVYGMAQRHGADFEVESGVGSGTTVRLSFPIVDVSAESAAASRSAAGVVQELNILIIDDDPRLLQSLHDTLRTDGHIVTLADGGQAGIDAFKSALERRHPFDMVITDLGMPYIDGRKVAAAIRLAAPLTPIILLTGWGQRMMSSNDLPTSVDRVLAKPPKLRELRDAISELVMRGRLDN